MCIRDSDLGQFIETGIKIDGRISSQLLINIFEKNTPLHDGAVIIDENRVNGKPFLFSQDLSSVLIMVLSSLYHRIIRELSMICLLYTSYTRLRG